MLESMRRSGASIFIYLIFGLLIVIFVINFAPNAGKGEGGGCTGTSNTAITVDGSKSTQSAYHVAYSQDRISFFQRTEGKSRVQTYNALELLIRREILAKAAADRGLRATGEMVNEEIKKGYFFVGGFRIPIMNVIFDDVDGEKFYNHGRFKRWVSQLNVSQGSYVDEQTRSLQAAMMAELLESSVRVSREEALSAYLFANNTLTYDVATFSPTDYAQAMRLTDADVQRFLATHEDEVKAKYKADERTYKGTKPALKLRQIFVASAEPAAAKPADDKATDKATDNKPADDKATDKTAEKADKTEKSDKTDKAGAAEPKAPTPDEAKAKLEAARTAIAAGKEKFAEAAKQLSVDETTKWNGGDLGWHTVDNAQLGDPALNAAVKALKPGEMTPVITTQAGAYLIQADDKREGDLSYDQAKQEIAATLAREVWSKEAAKRASIAGLAAVTGGKKLDDVFKRDVDKQEEERRFQIQMQKQLQKQGIQIPNKTGAIEIESKDIPAGWYAADDSTGGSAASGSAAPAPKAPAAGGTTAGSAAPAPKAPAAGGTTAGSAAGAPDAKPAAVAVTPPADPMQPSKDVLPAFGDVKAKVIKHGPWPRMKAMPGIGDSVEVTKALFDELAVGGVSKKVYEVDGNYVLFQLVQKDAPDADEFDKNADVLVGKLREVRAQAFLEDWLKGRCEQLAKDGKIKPMADLIRETDDKGNPAPTVYRPCMSFR